MPELGIQPDIPAEAPARRSLKKRLLRILLIVFVAALILIVLAWARWRFASPTISYQSLDEYKAEYNEHQGTERAWDILKGYVGREFMLTPPETSALFSGFPPEPRDPTFEEGVEFINGMQSEVALLRDAAARPVFGYDYPGKTTLDTPVVLASLSVDTSSMVRKAVRMLKMDALAAIHQRDSDRFVKDVDALLGFARIMHARLAAIDTLTGNAIVFVATDVIGECDKAGWPDVTDEELARLVLAFDLVKPNAPLVEELRRSQRDHLQRVFTDDGDGHGRICAEGSQYLADLTNVPEQKKFGFVSLTLVSSFRWPDRAEVQAECDNVNDAIRAWLEQPLWERGDFKQAARVGRLRSNDQWGLSAWPTLVGVVSIPAQSANDATCIMSAHAARVALAAELHRRKNGALPETLEQLRERLGGLIPVDAFTGEPLKYVVRGGRVLVYSVGNDRDDDGGRGLVGTDAYKAAKWCAVGDTSVVVDADYVLFPQED